MSLVSAVAYAGFVLLAAFLVGRPLSLAALPSGMAPARLGPRRPLRGALAFLSPLAAFFFLPPGSLPPFCNGAWGGAAFLCLFALSPLAENRRDLAAPFLLMGGVACACAGYAYGRGFPGSFANLGTFAAMPLWRVASLPETAGFAALTASGALAAGSFAPPPGEAFSRPEAARHLASGALLVVLFFPWNSAPFVSWPDMAVAGFDFLAFWCKTAVVCYGIRRLRLVPRRLAASLACFCLGVGLLAAAYSG
jgi:hypothetical protein